ncbi:MAG: hypothetical protein MZV64_10950 [Ignavibacteriales bacterium]|nr:hypothetical protein [Ignavibacteriales bacterium]
MSSRPRRTGLRLLPQAPAGPHRPGRRSAPNPTCTPNTSRATSTRPPAGPATPGRRGRPPGCTGWPTTTSSASGRSTRASSSIRSSPRAWTGFRVERVFRGARYLDRGREPGRRGVGGPLDRGRRPSPRGRDHRAAAGRNGLPGLRHHGPDRVTSEGVCRHAPISAESDPDPGRHPGHPAAAHRRHVGLQSRGGENGQPLFPDPARPGPVARDVPAHGQERGRDPLLRAPGDRRARRPRKGPQEDLPRLRRPDHAARGRLLPHVRHGHGRRLPAGAGPDRELPGLPLPRPRRGRGRPQRRPLPGEGRRRLPPARAAQQVQARGRAEDGQRDLAGRVEGPRQVEAVRPGHGRALPLLGRVHRLGAPARQDPARLAPRLPRRGDALRQRQHLPGRGRPARPRGPDQGRRPVEGQHPRAEGAVRARGPGPERRLPVGPRRRGVRRRGLRAAREPGQGLLRGGRHGGRPGRDDGRRAPRGGLRRPDLSPFDPLL